MSQFRLRLIPTPDWAAQGTLHSPLMTPEQVQMLQAQAPIIPAQVERAFDQALRWALTDPGLSLRLQRQNWYTEGIHLDYFIGRQYVEPVIPGNGQFILETECCLTHLNFRGLPAIYHRYTIPVKWTLVDMHGTLLLGRESERESQLAHLDYRLTRTFDLASVPESDGLSPTLRTLLLTRWSEILDCVQKAATEAVEDGSGSGKIDDDFFPCRLAMTGEYYIESIDGDDPARIVVMLHFLEHPFMFDQAGVDYLGYDLSLDLTAHPMTYELWGSSAI